MISSLRARSSSVGAYLRDVRIGFGLGDGAARLLEQADESGAVSDGADLTSASHDDGKQRLRCGLRFMACLLIAAAERAAAAVAVRRAFAPAQRCVACAGRAEPASISVTSCSCCLARAVDSASCASTSAWSARRAATSASCLSAAACAAANLLRAVFEFDLRELRGLRLLGTFDRALGDCELFDRHGCRRTGDDAEGDQRTRMRCEFRSR